MQRSRALGRHVQRRRLRRAREPDHAFRGWAAVQRQPSPDPIEGASAELGPCLIDAPRLDNVGLLEQLNRARVYLSRHRRGQDQWFDYHNLFRRLLRERERRIHAGHVWLKQPGLLDIPPVLYLIIPSAEDQLRVSQVAGTWAVTVQLTGEILITGDQFQQ